MFKRHATFQIAGSKRPGRQPAMPHAITAAPANDNLRGFRRPSDQRRSALPKLVCRWIMGDGNHLECRWQVEVGPTPGSSLAAAVQDFTQRSLKRLNQEPAAEVRSGRPRQERCETRRHA